MSHDGSKVTEAQVMSALADRAKTQAEAIIRLSRSVRRTQNALIAVGAWTLFLTLQVWGVM